MNIYPAERLNMGLSAGAVAASYAVATPEFAASLALGAAMEAMNFRFLHRVSELFFRGVVQGGGPWLVVLALRMVLLCGGLGLALLWGANPLALVIGVSLVMPATVIAALWNRPEIVPQPLADVPPPDDPSWDQYSVWRAGPIEASDDTDAHGELSRSTRDARESEENRW